MNFILQAAPANNIFLILIMFGGLFLLMIYPQMRRQKQEKKFYEGLKKGDKVIMKSGLHGRILEINDNSIIIETLSGKLKFERSEVSLDYSKKLNSTENK